MGMKLKKSIFIGLGGTGARALLHAKGKIRSIYGEIPPMIRFVVLDTDPKLKSVRGPDGETVTFTKNEFLHISVPNGLKFIEAHEHVDQFFPDENKKNAGAITKGAGQIRSLGRLALAFNYRDVRERLSKIVDSLRTYTPAPDSPYEIHGGNIQVSVAFSTSGGTGSGTFLDLPYVLRDIGIDHTDTMLAYILMPNIFLQFEGTKNVEANCYGAFKEMDFMMDGHLLDEVIDYGGENKISMKSNPYDNILTIDNITANKTGQNDINALNQIMGTGLYLSTGVIGDAGDTVWDNLRKFVTDSQRIKGKSPNYTSMGISELYYDGDKLKEIFACKLARHLKDKLTVAAPDINVDNDVDAKLNEWKIRESQPHDEVIDAIFDMSQGSGLRPSEPDDFRKGTHENARLNAQKFLEIVKESLKQADLNTEQLVADKKKLIEDYLKEKSNKEGGVFYVKKFVAELRGNLEAYREEMKTEKMSYEELEVAKSAESKGFIEDIVDEEEGFNPIGKKGRIREACEDYFSKVVEQANALKEAKRRDNAIRFYNSILDLCDHELENMRRIEDHFDDIETNVRKEVVMLTDKRVGANPYIISLHDLFLDQVEVGDGDYNMVDFFNSLGENKLYKWGKMNNQDVLNLFKQYAYSTDKANKFAGKDIDTAFRELDPKMKTKVLESMDLKSDPLWTFQQEVMIDKPSYVYLIGVNDERNTALKDEDPTNKMTLIENALGKRPNMAVTNDPKRIYFYKFGAAVPAFILSKMERFKRKYESESARFNYHVDENWEKMMNEIGYDLFPSKDEESILRLWAEVNAFGLVKRKSLRGPYIVKQEEGTDPLNDDYASLDTTDRRAAYLEFSKKHAAMSSTLLEAEYKRLGDEKVLEGLIAYHETFKENVKEFTNMKMDTLKQNEGTYKLVNNELRIIANLIKEYQSKL